MSKITIPLVTAALVAGAGTTQIVFAQDTNTLNSSLEILNNRVANFPDNTRVSQLNTQKLEELKTILLTNFEQKAIQLAKEDYVTEIKTLDSKGLSKYFTPIVIRLTKEYPNWTREYRSAEAMKLAIAQANEDLYTNASWQANITQVKDLFTQLLANNLLTSSSTLTIGNLKADIHKIHRALFYLVQNFNFEADLPSKLVLAPESFAGVPAQRNAYERLVHYGTTDISRDNRTKKNIIDNFVRLSNGTKQYDEKVKPYAGLNIFQLFN